MKFARSGALLAAVGATAILSTCSVFAHEGGHGEAAAAPSGPSDVLDLTGETFKNIVDPESLILVEFYAPWCGHCQALAPHLESAATELKTQNIKIAKVDCTVNEELCAEHEVGGYPTLKVFRNGTPSEYAGTRKTDGIVSYMQKQSLPAVSVVSAANLAEFKTKDRFVVVAFLSESDSKDKDAYSGIAESLRDSYIFGLSTDAEAASAAGVSAPALVVYRSFDEPEVKYPGKFEADAIKTFLSTESMALVDEVGPDNFMSYAEAGIPLAYYFTEPEDKNRESAVDSLKTLAKEYRGKLNFVWIDAVKFVNHAKGLNLKGDEWPAFAIQDIQGNTKYPLDTLGKDPLKSIGSFVKDFVAGSIKPSIKSEPVLKVQDGPVHVLAADEFDTIVFDDKKDVLLELYAPWCGHCKNLAPTYDLLGKKYAAEKSKIVIAKMDATTNDVPPSAGFQVQSFPTIKFKPAGSKTFIDFEGDRSLESFVDFIGLNAKNKVTPAVGDANDTEQAAPEEGRIHHEEL